MKSLHIIHTLHRAEQITNELLDSAFKDQGLHLTGRQMQVLTAIASETGKSQTDIVLETDIDRSTLADICRRLKNKGLISRRRTKEDARAYALALTDEGKTILARADKALAKFEKGLRQRISGLDQLRIVEPVREAAE